MFGHVEQVDCISLEPIVDEEEKRTLERLSSFPGQQLSVLVSTVILEPVQGRAVF